MEMCTVMVTIHGLVPVLMVGILRDWDSVIAPTNESAVSKSPCLSVETTFSALVCT